MVYRKPHPSCTEVDCQSYSAYIRVQKKWIKAGEYNSKCRSFTPVDDVKTYDKIIQEEYDTLLKEKLPFLKSMVGIQDVDTSNAQV